MEPLQSRLKVAEKDFKREMEKLKEIENGY